MGCDIHTYVEVKQGGEWKFVKPEFPSWHGDPVYSPFDNRNYGVFSFLGLPDRNYGRITPLASLRGFPRGASKEVKEKKRRWEVVGHSSSWFTVEELLSVNYDEIIEDRRCTRQLGPKYWSGAETCEVGEGEKLPLRQYLGESFFKDLEILKGLGSPSDVRIIFWFDN